MKRQFRQKFRIRLRNTSVFPTQNGKGSQFGVFRFKIFREFSHCVIHCEAEQFKNYGEKFTIKHSQLSCQTVTLISGENKIRNKD